MQKKLNKLYVKRINLMFIWGFFTLFLIALFLRLTIVGDPLTKQEALEKVIETLLGILLPLPFFSVVYNYLTKEFQNEEISEKIAETMALNKNVIDNFDDNTKKIFVKNAVESILGVDEGDVLYSTLIQPYLNKEYTFRKNFEYFITYEEPCLKTQLGESIIFDSTHYYWVHEDLSYTKCIGLKQKARQTISIGFVYDSIIIDGWFGKQDLFFREMLCLCEYDKQRFMEFTSAEVKHFTDNVLNIKLAINNIQIKSYEVEIDPDKNGFMLNFILPHDVYVKMGSESHFHIKFKMPQKKRDKLFLVVLPEPTYNTRVQFTYIPEKMKVTPILFFNEQVDKEKTCTQRRISNHYLLEVNDWVIPRSGVVFVWDDIEDDNNSA